MEQKLTVHENQSPLFKMASFWNAPLYPLDWNNDIFDSTRKNMSQMFDGFFENWPALKNQPTADIIKHRKCMHIKMNVPAGLEAKDIDISTEDGMLTISAEKEESINGAESRYSFSYSTNLPENVSIDEAKVSLANHKLNIDIPKKDGKEQPAAVTKSAKNGRHKKARR